MRPPALLRLALGCLAGLLALWLAARGVDSSAVWSALASLRPAWILAAAVLVGLTILSLVIRWRVLLGPGANLRSLVDAVLVGQMLNILLPIRLGEVARVFIVTGATGRSPAGVLATIAVEKLGDLVMVGASAGALMASAALPAAAYGAGPALVVTGAVAAAAAVLGLRPAVISRLAAHATRLAPVRWQPLLERHITAAVSGLTSLRTPGARLEFWLLSAGIVLLAASTNHLVMMAFDLRLPAVAALAVFVALQVGTAVVSVPGNLGVFHYVVVLVLAGHGVDQSTALGYATVLYGVAILPKIAAGGFLLAFEYRWVLFRAEPRT